jgi:type VI secretion system protein ImpF
VSTTTTNALDRLQPALLDRLTDDDPSSKSEPVSMRVISRSRLREAVLRDLSWLFNTTCLGLDQQLQDSPAVLASVLNYGLPALSGRVASSVDALGLEHKVRTAIVNFEPRIVADSLRVELLFSAKQLDHHNQVSFKISGQIWAQPVPLELLLHTDVDLETGQVGIKDLAR